eukprot:jgi/Orpsp1_1/1190783/evm.model.d7180000081211.1
MIPLEKFLEVAPESLKNDNDNPHRQMINRLSFELEERKRLSKAERELTDNKKIINEKLMKQKEKLNHIDDQLEQLIKNSFTLQESLKLPQTYVRKQNEISLLLPEPLFVLYKQAIGYQEAYDNKITTEILGDPSMISAYIQKEKSKKNSDSNNNSRASPISSVHSSPLLGPKKKHNRHSSNTNVSNIVSKSNSLYKIFPLRVQIKFKTIDVIFSYLPELNIVTVVPEVQKRFKSISSLSFLSCLYKNDTGEISPNPANALLLNHKNDKKAFSFQPDKEYGYAYSWAQVICGLDFAPIINYERNIVFSDNEIDDPHKLMRYPCFAEIVALIDERIHSIEVLEDQIKHLSDGNFIVESHINVKDLPVKLLYLKMNDLNNFDVVISINE